MIFEHASIRRIMYTRVLIHSPMVVTSPPCFQKRSRKVSPTIPIPNKILTYPTVQSHSPTAPHALWSKLPASDRLHRPTTVPTSERIPDPLIQLLYLLTELQETKKALAKLHSYVHYFHIVKLASK